MRSFFPHRISISGRVGRRVEPQASTRQSLGIELACSGGDDGGGDDDTDGDGVGIGIGIGVDVDVCRWCWW